jgi:hypothetical protein
VSILTDGHEQIFVIKSQSREFYGLVIKSGRERNGEETGRISRIGNLFSVIPFS